MKSEDVVIFLCGITGIFAGMYFLMSGAGSGYGFIFWGVVMVAAVIYIQHKEKHDSLRKLQVSGVQ